MNRALRARRRSAPLTFGILAILVALGSLIATAKAQNLSAESDAFDAFADDVAFHTEEVTELTVDLLETGVETEIFVLERTRQLARADTLARSANVFGAVADGLMEAPEIYLAAKQHGAKGLARETVGAGIQVGLGLATGFACGHAAAFATGVVLATGVGAPAAPVVYAFGFFVCQYAGGKVADKIEDRVEGGLGKILGIPDGRNGRARNSRASTVAGRANRPPRGAGVRVGNVDINAATGDVTTTANKMGNFDALFYHAVYADYMGSIKGHFGPVNSIAIHPEGKSFTTGGEDGYIRLHHFEKSYFNGKHNFY